METVRSNGIPWRAIGWGLAALLLLVPLIAMQLTPEIAWSAGDFLVFGIMLLAAGVGIEIVSRSLQKGAPRTLAIFGIVSVFVAVWALLAVGLG